MLHERSASSICNMIGTSISNSGHKQRILEGSKQRTQHTHTQYMNAKHIHHCQTQHQASIERAQRSANQSKKASIVRRKVHVIMTFSHKKRIHLSISSNYRNITYVSTPTGNMQYFDISYDLFFWRCMELGVSADRFATIWLRLSVTTCASVNIRQTVEISFDVCRGCSETRLTSLQVTGRKALDIKITSLKVSKATFK